VTPGPVIVSRYRDVLEVASLDRIYGVKPYGIAMMRDNGGANFILGMEDGPEFETELALLHLAVKRSDLDRIRGIVARLATALVEKAKPSGQMDITDGYARLVPTLFAGEYFGVPGPDPTTLMNWVRVMFTDIFLNFTGNQAVSAAGIKAGKEFRDYVDALIASIKADKRMGDDVIGRLLSMQCNPGAAFTDTRLRDNLIGCISGILENTNTAIVNIMDYLFDNPHTLQGAVAAAKAGDNPLLLNYVLEVLRFHSPAPILVRMSLSEHVLARGTQFETKVPSGKVVFAANSSAMMDDSELDQPQEFKLGRPSHHYLHFGWGIHQCLGKYISEVQVVEIVKALLVQDNLRRADGEAGKLRYAGPFPKSFVIQFG
jgi:cytochrome P450